MQQPLRAAVRALGDFAASRTAASAADQGLQTSGRALHAWLPGAQPPSACKCLPGAMRVLRAACAAHRLHTSPSLEAGFKRKALRAPRARPKPKATPLQTAAQAYTGRYPEVLAEAATLPALVLTRNLEMMDLMLGYEQARQMLLRAPDGRPLLAVAERPGGLFTAALTRQIMDSSRAFTIDVFDVASLQMHSAEPGQALFTIHRSFPWFNPMGWLHREITIHNQHDHLIGSVVRVWQPLHRSYDLYIVRDEDIGSEDPVLTQFGRVSEPFWGALFTWRYPVRAPDDSQISLIERMFGAGMQGLATQMFTEVGNYHLAFEEPAQTLHQRMVTAACAISVDYDYYSRRVGGGGLLWAPWVFGGGSSDD